MSLAEGSEGVDLCAIAYGTNPNGSPPNFNNPPSLQPTFIGVSAFLVIFVVVITSGRLYINKHSLKWADYFMIIGLILDLALTGVLISLSRNFRHAWDTPICYYNAHYLKLTYVEVLLVGPSLFFPKSAIFLFYLQVFSVRSSVRIGSKIGLVLAFLAYIPLSLLLSYYDAPHVGQTWEESALSGLPVKGIPIGIAIGAASVFVDIYVFVLPLPALFSLNLSLKKRLQLMALFATAFTVAENNVAIIVGSLPAFVNFLRIHVSQMAFFKSLSSKLSLSSRSHATNPDNQRPPQKQTLWTFGSPPKQHPQYYELTDTAILKSYTSVPEGAMVEPLATDDGIVRTVGYSQEVHTRQPAAKIA